MSTLVIVWVMLVSPADAHGWPTVGGVFTSHALCEQAAKEVPEEGVKFTCLQRRLWSKL